MNHCTHCGASLDGAVNFCKNCGEKLDKGKSLALSEKTPTAGAANRKKLAIIIGAGAAVLTFALVLVFTVFLNKPETERPLTVAELLDLGEKYLLDFDYEQALVQFMAVIDIEPKNPRAYTGAAEAYIGLGDKDSAIAILQSGYEQLPDNRAISEKRDTLIDEREALQSTPTPTPFPTPEPTIDLYADLIAAFKRYEDSGWTDYSSELIADSYLVTIQTEQGLPPSAWDGFHDGFTADASLNYGLRDLTGDGVAELMIGTGDIPWVDIQGIYTVANDSVMPIYQNGHITIYDDNTFSYNPAGIGGSSHTRYIITENGRHNTVFSYERERENYWYYDANGNELSSAEARALMSQYSDTPVTLEWHPLSHFFEN